MPYVTKKDYVDLFKKMTMPLKNNYDEYGLEIGVTASCYESSTIPVEGFLRVLWGLTPFFAGKNEGLEDFIKIYNDGFKNGTDRTLPTYWGGFRECDQLFVEMAAIAFAMFFAKDKFWDPLDEKTKDNLSKWLYQINNYDIPENNWQMFRALVNAALKKLGREYSAEKLEEALNNTESYYVGNGWYTDGTTLQRDYYIPFAIHFYCLIYAAVMGDEDKERSERFKSRAEEFAHEFIYWFSEDGSSIPYGRSLTYRFAQVAFWSACLIADVKPFSYGVIKGILSRHFDDWMKYPIFDKSGLLTIGYRYPNLYMSESYNAPGSPYWSYKAFALLMLDDDHPFWKADIEPLPKLDKIKTLNAANMIITRNNGNVCAYVPGLIKQIWHDQSDCKYSKFVYSTQFGFSVERSAYSLNKNAPDSMLAFVIDEHVFVRNVIDDYKIEDGRIYSKWSPFTGISVETVIIPSEEGHIRKHTIISDWECEAYDCGFSVYVDDALKTSYTECRAEVSNGNSRCVVESQSGTGHVIMADPNTNVLFNKTAIPSIKYKINKGITVVETIVK
jgi:hypothetical protein